MKFTLVLVAVLVAMVQSTSAELVTNTFVGQITKLRVGPDSHGHPAVNTDGPAIGGTFAGLRAADTMSFSFVYDSLAAPIWTDPTGSERYGVVAWSITAGGGHISDTGDNDFIMVFNDYGRDLFGVTIQGNYSAGVQFLDLGMDALSSTAIPNTFDLGNWDKQIYAFDADGRFNLPGSTVVGAERSVETPLAYFRVDSFYSSVPEPSVAGLLGMAFAAFLLFKWRSHRRKYET